MRFVGVDLAWGGRRPSGLAVLEPGGNVVAEGWATTDEDIRGFLAAHDGGGAVVALDAPLVVANPAGTRRECEAELQRRYGPAATLVAGDDATGAILVPRPPG